MSGGSGIVRTAVGLVLAAVSVIGFASTFVFGAALTKDAGVSPEVLSFLRFAIAGLVMLLADTARRPRLRVSCRDFLTLLWLGPVGTSLMAYFVFMGCARVSAANASMADALTPIMISVVALFRTRRMTGREAISLLVGFLGALLVIQVVNARGVALSAYSLGDVFVFLAAAVWGVYTVYGRDLIARLGSAAFTVWTMLIGAAAIGLILPFGDFVWPKTAHAWLMVGGLGTVSTLMPFWTWNAAQRFLPVPVLGITAYFTPVVAVALAAVFLGERATALQWLGTGFVVLSAVILVRRSV